MSTASVFTKCASLSPCFTGHKHVCPPDSGVVPRFHGQQLRPSGRSQRSKLMVSAGLSRDEIRKLQKNSREQQVESTKLMMLLLQAGDAQAVAEEHQESLTEEFFTIASTYLQLAKKEGEQQVVDQVESVLRVAMAVKNKTLRPEIQLLNRLLSTPLPTQRSRILSEEGVADVLSMSDGYFFTLVEHVTKDMQRQPDSSHRSKVLQQLADIKQEAEQLLQANGN